MSYFTKALPFHKVIDTGCQTDASGSGFDYLLRFHTRNDCAGLSFFVKCGSFLFEFNVHDDRHWNYDADRWYEHGEEEALFERERAVEAALNAVGVYVEDHPVFEGYPHE